MKTHPLVSIIIPFYNRIEITVQSLKTALNQTYENTEIILINDGSTDSIAPLEKIVASNTNCTLVTTKNKGPAHARNLGVNVANGEYLAFLDSDDLWENNKIEIQLNYMIKNNWHFSYTPYYILDDKSNSIKSTSKCRISYFYPLPAFYCSIATPTVMIKKNLVQDVKFDETLRAGEDTLFWLQISKKARLNLLNIPLTTVRVGSSTTAKNSKIKLLAFKNINKIAFENNATLRKAHLFYVSLREYFGLI